MKTQDKPRKPTYLERLAESAAQDFAHANSAVIASRRRVLQFEAEEADKSIVALQATLATMKERRAKLTAIIAGLSLVIGKR